MIYDELKNLIMLTRADDTITVFDNAVGLFDIMGEDNYMQIFEATISSSPDLTADQLIDELLADLHVIVDSIFSMQGIGLSDDTFISDKVKIAKGLLNIFDYSDKNSICRILETDQSPEEMLCEVLGLVCDIQTEEIFTMITKVNPEVITRMRTLINPLEEMNSNDPYSDAIKAIIGTYIQFKENVLESKPFYTDKYLSTLDTIGLDYQTYLDDILRHKEFRDLLGAMDDAPKLGNSDVFDSVSKYLIAIAILSIDGNQNYINTIKNHITDITSNVSSLTRLDTAISQNLIKLSRTGKT